MAEQQAQRFMKTLQRLEDQGDLDRIVSMFSDQAELRNPTEGQPYRGRQGAEAFWDAYRRSFEKIHSDFHNVTESDGAVMLEWTSRGQLSDGAPFEYDGVSVLEYEDGEIRRFRAYFNPPDFGAQVTKSLE